MFRCEKCRQLSRPGESPILVVVDTRSRVYPRREHAMRRGRGLYRHDVVDPGGYGYETVRAELWHTTCNDRTPKDVPRRLDEVKQ